MYETMPDHNLPEELIAFRDSIRRFVDKELRPLEKKVTIDGKLPPKSRPKSPPRPRQRVSG